MKKISLKNHNLKELEKLSREQFKNVLSRCTGGNKFIMEQKRISPATMVLADAAQYMVYQKNRVLISVKVLKMVANLLIEKKPLLALIKIR